MRSHDSLRLAYTEAGRDQPRRQERKLNNADLRARVHDVTKSSYDIGAEWLRTFDPNELLMSPKDLRVLHTLIEGLVMQCILTPALCPDQVFYEAFAAMADRSADRARRS